MASVFFVRSVPYNDRTTETERKPFIDRYCTCTVEYRESALHCLSAPPPPIFHIERIGIMNAPPLVYPPRPFSERPLSRYLASDERPPSCYLASDAPTMHNEVPKCAWHLSGNEADYSLGLQGKHNNHGMIVEVSSCLRSCSRSPMEGVQSFL